VVSVCVSWSCSSEDVPLDPLVPESVVLDADDEDAQTANAATRAASTARAPVSPIARFLVMPHLLSLVRCGVAFQDTNRT
jgi:hypothetical protein